MSAVPEEVGDEDQDHIRPGLLKILESQQAAFRASKGGPDYRGRIAALDRFSEGLYARRHDFCKSLNEDFGGRAAEETLILEIFVLLDEIRHTKRHLKKWMRTRRVMPNWQFLPGGARCVYQPLGVVGVMGAWNYQLLLTFSPMIGAISAGNHVMMKPSELAPRTAELMRELIAECFPEEYVTVITGDVDVASAFSTLPFNHLIFTGSTRVGKIIMRNASEHLTPVTLELGGKSPAIVTDDYPVESAARRIVHGKLSNCGQTCVAPDYVLIHEDLRDDFIRQAQSFVQQYYPSLLDNADYTRIVSPRHYQRLEKLVNEVRERGGQVLQVNPKNEDCSVDNRVFPPTIVWDVPEDTGVMQEELFGPILPLVTYRTIDDAIEYINDRPRPLALYHFDSHKDRIRRILRETICGGVTLNGCIYHLPQNNLPFGGVGDSGMGAYHGFDGFMTFSKKKSVFIQRRMAATMLLRPPYGKFTAFLIGTLMRNWPSFEKLRR